jgi:MtrB/PioB family decaheme-associated outer membrane protein
MKTLRWLSAVTLALVLAPSLASGQTVGWTVPTGTNIIDVGARGSSINGDSARYERYRDLGDGLFLEAIRWDGTRNDWLFSLKGDHTLYKDQRYVGRAERPGRLKAWFLWDQVPMLMSNTTQTLFREDFADEPNSFTIDPAIRAQVQASASASPNTAIVPSLFANNARTFETFGRRHFAQTGAEYIATPELSIKGVYQYTNRQGVTPYGGSYGHSSLVEFPAPIAHVTNDFDTNAEWARDKLLLRAGYTGSWFTNHNTTATFENPFRTYESLPSGCTPAPGVSAQCSGSPATGRLSLPPSNSFFTLNGLASYQLAPRTRVSFYLSGGTLKDAGDPIMSNTVNPLNQGVLTALDRTTVDGEARTLSTNLNFVSRPNRYVDVSARFRTYEYDNKTPPFALTQRVSYDNAPGVASMSTLGGVNVPYTTNAIHTEPFGVARQMLDLDFRLTPRAMMVAGVGYSRLGEERSHRLIEDTTDHVFRLTFDTVGNRWFTLRTKYEHATRSGEATDEAQEAIFGIGEQPGIRHFDIASRNRNRITILGSTMLRPDTSLYASVAFGKDDYTESEFGLRDNRHRIFTVGSDLMPRENVALGVSYSYEYYNALSRSRQANPPGSQSPALPSITYAQYLAQVEAPTTNYQIADATRNWSSDGTDRAHSIIVFGEVLNIRSRMDLHFTYDMNRAEAAYNYITGPVTDRTLPDEAPPTTLTNCNVPENCKLPLVTNDFDRFTTDLTYWLSQRVGIGGSYWHERFRVTDWALDAEATSQEVLSQAMILGYNYRPYTANTFFGRLLLRF